jgi:hypothetical protein
MILTVAFRERFTILIVVGLMIAAALAIFWVEYHAEIAKEYIPSGRYDTDLFAARNLAFMMGAMVEYLGRPFVWAAPMGSIMTGALYFALVGVCIASAAASWEWGRCVPRLLYSVVASGYFS